MKIRIDKHGFTASIVLLSAVTVGVLGLTGFVVYNQSTKNNASDVSKNQTKGTQPLSASNDIAPAPELSSKEDLDKAATTVDQTDPNPSEPDINELDNELSAF